MAVNGLPTAGGFQLTQGTHGISQNTVHQTGSVPLFFAIFLGQGDRFVHRSRLRDTIHLIELVQTQMENIPNGRMQILQFACEQLAQIMIQLDPILHHTVTQPCSQSRLTAIQTIPADILF